MLGRDLALFVVSFHSPLGICTAPVTSVCSLISAPAERAALRSASRQVGRRDVAVVRVIQRADDRRRVGIATQVHQRPQFLDLGR